MAVGLEPGRAFSHSCRIFDATQGNVGCGTPAGHCPPRPSRVSPAVPNINAACLPGSSHGHVRGGPLSLSPSQAHAAPHTGEHRARLLVREPLGTQKRCPGGRTDRNAAQHCGAHFQLRDGQAASSSVREGREEWDNLPNNDARAATLGTVHARFQ